MNQGNKSGDVEKWSDSRYVSKQCLLLTPYLDQYKKLRTSEQKPVLPLRRCISEELERKEIECGSRSCVNTFCPYQPFPSDLLSICVFFQNEKGSLSFCTIQRILPFESHLPFFSLYRLCGFFSDAPGSSAWFHLSRRDSWGTSGAGIQLCSVTFGLLQFLILQAVLLHP